MVHNRSICLTSPGAEVLGMLRMFRRGYTHRQRELCVVQLDQLNVTGRLNVGQPKIVRLELTLYGPQQFFSARETELVTEKNDLTLMDKGLVFPISSL